MGYEVNPQHSDTQAAIDAGLHLSDPIQLTPDSRVLGIVVPQGARLEQIDLEKYASRPTRKTGAFTLATVQSFYEFVNRYKTPETVIYADQDSTYFQAVFNGHVANQQPTEGSEGSEGKPFVHGAAGWGDFTAEYRCPLSTEWARWHGKSQHDADVDEKVGMRHKEYIQFIEDNLLDITAPPSGAMLQMVRAFETKKDISFKSAARLENGDIAFAYSEETKEVDGRLTLPEQFTITIPVFKGGIHYAIDAKLRCRIGSGGLVLWHELVRPHKSLEHAFTSVRDVISYETKLPIFYV